MEKEVYNGLSFTEAYAAMRAGALVRRHGRKGHWGYNKETENEFICLPKDGKTITYGKLNLTMKDCAATDWEVIPAEDGTAVAYVVHPTKFEGISFTEAYKAMKAGSNVRRHGFKGYWAINEENGEAYVMLPDGKKTVTYGKLGLTMRSCSCTDWEVITETTEENVSPEAAQSAE